MALTIKAFDAQACYLNNARLVEIYNSVADKPTKRFSNRQTGIKRTRKALEAYWAKVDSDRAAGATQPKTRTTALIEVLENADALTLDELVALLEVDQKRVRSAIDHARSRGFKIEHTAHRAWKLVR